MLFAHHLNISYLKIPLGAVIFVTLYKTNLDLA